jgi:hypothetical protein
LLPYLGFSCCLERCMCSVQRTVQVGRGCTHAHAPSKGSHAPPTARPPPVGHKNSPHTTTTTTNSNGSIEQGRRPRQGRGQAETFPRRSFAQTRFKVELRDAAIAGVKQCLRHRDAPPLRHGWSRHAIWRRCSCCCKWRHVNDIRLHARTTEPQEGGNVGSVIVSKEEGG